MTEAATPDLGDDFDAGEIKPLRYRFSVDQQWATIPEPSSEAIIHFYEQWVMVGDRALERSEQQGPPKDEAGLPTEESIEARNERISMNLARQAKEFLAANEERIVLVAEVTGIPEENLRALGHRVRDGFFGYVVGKLSPQA